MTCAEVRHLILIADPSALRRRDDASLGAHLDGCASCAADVSRVLGDIDRLRSALIARGARPVVVRARRSRARVVATVIPLALAAELALFAFLSNRDTVSPLTSRRVIDDTVTTLLPVAQTHIDTGEVARSATPPKHKAVAATPRAADDSAMRADSAARADALSEPAGLEPVTQLQVVAPAGRRQRVAVLGTTDPKVHVVWLTKVDSL